MRNLDLRIESQKTDNHGDEFAGDAAVAPRQQSEDDGADRSKQNLVAKSRSSKRDGATILPANSGRWSTSAEPSKARQAVHDRSRRVWTSETNQGKTVPINLSLSRRLDVQSSDQSYRTKAKGYKKGDTSTDLFWHWATASTLYPVARDTWITAIPNSPGYWRTLSAAIAEPLWSRTCRRWACIGTKARTPWSTQIAPTRFPTRSSGTSWTSVTCTSRSIAT